LRGEGRSWDWRAEARSLAPAGEHLLLRLPELAAGYYELHVKARGRVSAATSSTLVVASPARAYREDNRGREWGVFLPLYALLSPRSWGFADLSDLRSLARWTRSLGGSNVATLPLLATFLEEAISDPSPYSPATRLMWNEIYVDLARLPDLTASESARRLVASPAFQRQLEALRSSRLVDYARLAGLRRAVLRELAASLSVERRRAASGLAERVNAELPPLGLPVDAFGIAVESGEIGPSGADRVEFTFAPNPGEPPRPLSRIASGGEASRLSLALKVVLAAADETPVLIFDEIDAGVGGRNATALGERLRALSAFHQVICVTHLPQIAAYADAHVHVGKREIDGRTVADARVLSPEERTLELAAMLAGSDAGSEAHAAAEALLRSAAG